MSDESLQILELLVENFKRVRVARITPSGSVVIVGGKNGAGKSSVLDAIEGALGGAKTLPPDPVRHGAKKSRTVVDLGELRVERTITGAGKPALVVTRADGSKVDGPQALLDSLCARVSFDPLDFVRMKPEEQDRVLKSLVPALATEIAHIEHRAAEAFELRKEKNREAKSLEARLKPLPPALEGDVPDTEVDAAELLEDLRNRRSKNAQNKLTRDKVTSLWGAAATQDAEAKRLEDEIAELEEALATTRRHLDELGKERTATATALTAAKQAVAELVDEDEAEVERKLGDLSETNRKIRERAERTKLEHELATVEREAGDLTRKLEDLDELRENAIAGASFPVEGLAFSSSGVTFNGVPIEQASQAEKLRVGVAIGAALNPRVKVVLVRNGNDLDATSMTLLAELAAKAGLQVWLERVSDDGVGCSVVLEDGLVKEETTDG